MRTDRSVLSVGFALALGMAFCSLLSTGCPGTLDDKERFLLDAGNRDAAAETSTDPDSGPCGNVVTRIFIPSCGGTGCHGASAPQQDLDLVSPGVAARVVGVSGTGCLATLADPANPEASLIYQKLSPTPPCGAPMPLARPALDDQDLACVLAWIAAQ